MLVRYDYSWSFGDGDDSGDGKGDGYYDDEPIEMPNLSDTTWGDGDLWWSILWELTRA